MTTSTINDKAVIITNHSNIWELVSAPREATQADLDAAIDALCVLLRRDPSRALRAIKWTLSPQQAKKFAQLALPPAERTWGTIRTGLEAVLTPADASTLAFNVRDQTRRAEKTTR